MPGVIDSTTNFVEHRGWSPSASSTTPIVGAVRVVASTDCGLATFAIGDAAVDARVAWAKLDALVRGAASAAGRAGLAADQEYRGRAGVAHSEPQEETVTDSRPEDRATAETAAGAVQGGGEQDATEGPRPDVGTDDSLVLDHDADPPEEVQPTTS